MNKIRINKAKLLHTLKDNMAAHIKEYDEALKEYRRQLTEILKKMIEEVDLEKDVNTYITLKKPKSYASYYSTAIKAAEWSEESEFFELTLKEFNHYINDEWDWKEDFNVSNSSYLGKFK